METKAGFTEAIDLAVPEAFAVRDPATAKYPKINKGGQDDVAQ